MTNISYPNKKTTTITKVLIMVNTRDVASSKNYESAKIKTSEMTRDNVLTGTQQFQLPLKLINLI